MISVSFPTSQNIFIKINNKKVATVENYKIMSTRKLEEIKGFGESESISLMPKSKSYTIELSRVLINMDDEEKIDFYNLSNFDLSILKHGKEVLFSNCEWTSLSESSSLNKTIVESMTLVATKRNVVS